MRYNRRHYYGGAKPPDNNKELEKVSNNNINKFEMNDWSSAWGIHNNDLPVLAAYLGPISKNGYFNRLANKTAQTNPKPNSAPALVDCTK